MLNLELATSQVDFSLEPFAFRDDSISSITTRDQQRHTPGQSLASPAFEGLTDFGDSTLVFDSPSWDRPPEVSANPLKDVLALCTELVDEFNTLRNSAPPLSGPDDPHKIGRAVQRALSGTSRLSDIFKDMAMTEAGPGQEGTTNMGRTQSWSPLRRGAEGLLTAAGLDSGPLAAGSEHQNHAEGRGRLYCVTCTGHTNTTGIHRGPDILLSTSLVTAYILLLRTWRLIYSWFHRLLTSDSPTESRLLLSLPSLELGGFRVQRSPSIQIAALLELSSSMLQAVETRLGIGNHDAQVNAEKCHHSKSSVLGTNPVAISIRDTLLSQEVLRAGTEDNLGNLSLTELMAEVKKQF
ncbi:hypothetical protein DL768_005527 [Monosporascus sp. mg162]|nr:hypothetical protein DL768_005527 [Monosporascus sp. mg162]